MFHNSQRGPIYVDTTFVSSSGHTPLSGGLRISTWKYVHNIYSFILLPSIVLSFIQLIYIHIDLRLIADM
jgi:hypothetical protein